MSDHARSVPIGRPEPPRSTYARGRDYLLRWLNWFGLARLLLAAVSIVVVVGGAMWLLRPPSPSVESTLPYANTGTVPATTLPMPTGSTATPAASTDTASEQPTTVVVHVAGAVVSPGVYELTPSARVIDAVTAAGGVASQADTDRINLAAPVADGLQIYVPIVGQPPPVGVPSAGPVPGSVPDTGGAGGPVDLNTATAGELEQLPGIGPATAAAIVDDRQRNGPFASVDELDRVSGIGPAKLESLAGLVTV